MPAATTKTTRDLVRRIQCEFLEMPGLRVTLTQAQGRWGVEDYACRAVLEAFVTARFLRRTRDGAFIRASL